VSLAFEQGDTDPNAVQLICQINPVTTVLDNDSIVIPVFLNNNVPNDSVAGFEL